jgi:prevent-host-death family protein
MLYTKRMDSTHSGPIGEAIATETVATRFSEVLDHTVHDQARIVLTRDGKRIAAIVPIEDYDTLEAVDDAQDAKIAADAIAAWRKAGCPPGTPHEELIARYGVDPD